MRLKNIDLFKGILIILVIIGHVLIGTMNESILRTIIYSFHMPLFIGISGFLFNVDKIVSFSLSTLLNKYLFRVIIPWSIAILFYFSISLFQKSSVNILTGLFKAFVYPYYHLWFIPAFLSWIVLTWLLIKIGIEEKFLLFAGLLISIITRLLLLYPEVYQNLGNFKLVIDLTLHTFRPYFYFFFVFGLIYKRLGLKKRPNLFDVILPLICLTGVIYLFYNPNKMFSLINFFIFNTFLLSLVLKVSVHSMIKSNKVVEWFGINSLAIYLWHVLPILISKLIIGNKDVTLFYITTFSLEIVFIIIYWYLLRYDFLKKYVFGL